MLSSLKDKVVCVTGAARRVGRAIALACAQAGANVVIHHGASDADAASAAAEARSYSVDALIVKADLSDPGEIAQMFDAIRAHYGWLDVMVNSAANFKRTPLLDVPLGEWQAVIDTNLRAPFLCIQHAARLMIASKRNGVIVNISDNSGLNAWASRPVHSISKAGVVMLTQVAALALAEHAIRVNCVVPGPVLAPAGSPPEVLGAIAAALPLKRIGNPDDIARAVMFLATNDFATGTVMRVDGGEGLAGGET
ncbi:MAG: SDR family oxidoreductase [Chloroflexales bacterium]|nr:SDR family oxidoreductase [Chloroflexales bacterium]